MKYINLTKGKRTIVDDDLYESLSKHKWHCAHGYAVRRIRVGGEQRILFMHRVILGTPNGSYTDHINGDKLDNRRENLRVCTTLENARNQGLQRNNTSGFKGVTWNKNDRRWRAQLMCSGKAFFLGNHKTREAAALAYNKAAIELYGKFARLNVIHTKGAK